MNTANASPFVHIIDKLNIHNKISFEDIASLYQLPYLLRFFEVGSYILRDGDIPDRCSILVSGVAYRHKVSETGLRQIVAIHMPGEILDIQQLHISISDSNVQTLTRCEIATISHTALRQLVAERPSIGHALSVLTLVELSLAREWMLNIGRRDGRTRIAHFLCEFAFRLGSHEPPAGEAYELPMTQEQLGDALGLTAIHVNRMMKGLVRDGLVGRGKRGIVIPDWQRLVKEAGFNSRYLHVND